MTDEELIQRLGSQHTAAIARLNASNVIDDLKPCPTCGGGAEFSTGKTGTGGDWHYIECSECEAMGPHVKYADHNIAVKEALAEAWNTRAGKSHE